MATPFFTEVFPGATPLKSGNSYISGGPVTDQDNPNEDVTKNFDAPWCIDPVSSWLDYNCGVEISLDPGTVLHKPLPQSLATVDTLGVVDVTDQALAANTNGINLASLGNYADVIQQMATSTYRFVLRGEAWRAGYQVPIPNLVSIAGVACVPTNPHNAGNWIKGNLLGGIPLWYAAWELHYIIASPPRGKPGQKFAPQNPAVAMQPDAELPKAVLVPTAPADQYAVQVAPRINVGNFVAK